ncbi:F0F1 ATP synthase subunit B family protein [Novosphingobium aquimarinum]|uniref:F0F1 ATP synthase subunit B family protein n=1 Tax=Novosphingobium aquimarinum TaxID=2682494 RepID=UPI0012EB9E14
MQQESAAEAAHGGQSPIKTETLADGKAEMQHGPELSALGFSPAGWVSLAIVVIFLIAFWKKVPGMLTGGLDKSIAEIRKQLDEAKALRAEAEALRQEYTNKIANAEKDAAAMLEHAKHEAEAIVAKAESDTTAVIGRREKMAEDKIAASERAAIAELRAQAAEAAATAAKGLIASKHTAAADSALVDRAIGSI